MRMQRINMDEVVGEVDRPGTEDSDRSVFTAASVIGVAFFFAFVCYGGTDGLQTQQDVDIQKSYVMAVICMTSVASSVILAPAFVVRLSPNTALCVVWGSHALYAMANLYPTAATLLPAAVIVGATLPALTVAQGVYTIALVDRCCGRLPAGAAGEEDMRLQAVTDHHGDRSPRLESCGCTRRILDDNLRRQNVFVFFNSILLACMAAGSLCGIIITPLLIGSAVDEQDRPMTSLVTTSSDLNCSLNDNDVADMITGFSNSTVLLNITTVDQSITTVVNPTSGITKTVSAAAVDELIEQGVVRSKLSCGVNKCPYLDPPFTGHTLSSRSTWHALIFVLFCNAVSVVLTALLPTLLSSNVHRSTAALPALHWDDGDGPGGYRMVGDGTRASESVRRKMLTTLYLFVDRRLLMLAPTTIVIGLTGSLTVAAFHQSFAGCDSNTSMIGHGTASQRGSFFITSLLTGLLIIHFVRRRTVVLVALLSTVFIVAVTLTWQTKSSEHDRSLIVVWCVVNGAVAGVLRAAVYGVFPVLFGVDRLDSALLHANLWDSVGAALAALIADWLCLVIRAWFVIFAAGAAAVGYACLECISNRSVASRGDSRSGGSVRSVVARSADQESLASVCVSPNEAGSLSTISSNRLNVLLNPFANRAYYRSTDRSLSTGFVNDA